MDASMKHSRMLWKRLPVKFSNLEASVSTILSCQNKQEMITRDLAVTQLTLWLKPGDLWLSDSYSELLEIHCNPQAFLLASKH